MLNINCYYINPSREVEGIRSYYCRKARELVWDCSSCAYKEESLKSLGKSFELSRIDMNLNLKSDELGNVFVNKEGVWNLLYKFKDQREAEEYISEVQPKERRIRLRGKK